jgi:hypothetical protein
MCTAAYRAALTRDLSSSAPARMPAASQCQAAEAGREGAVGQPLQLPGQDGLESRGVAAADAVTESSPAPGSQLAPDEVGWLSLASTGLIPPAK